MEEVETVELCEFTKQEAEWLCDLIQEKLIDMGKNPEGFAFNINVELPSVANNHAETKRENS